MNSLLAPKKENGDKSRYPILCNYCKKNFKDQPALRIHVRVNHADELAKSRIAFSLYGGSSNARPTVLGLPCQLIGRSARARITGRTFFIKGSSSSDISQVPTTESAPKNSGSIPQNHQEPAGSMPFMLQNLSAGGSSGSIYHSSLLSSTTCAASPSNMAAAGGNFRADSSSSSQPTFRTESKSGDSLHPNHVVPSFQSIHSENPPAYNHGGLPHLASAVIEPCPGRPPIVPYMFKESIHPVSPASGLPYHFEVGNQPLSPPLGRHQSLGPDQFAVGAHTVKYLIHDKYKHEKDSCVASLLGTSDMISSLGKATSSCSNRPPKPHDSFRALKLDLVLGGPGVSSTSTNKEDQGEFDLSLRL